MGGSRQPTPLSSTEFERLCALFPPDTVLPRKQMAALMANNTPAVARKWLDEKGLLDSQVSPYVHAGCADHPGEIEWPDSGCAECRAEP